MEGGVDLVEDVVEILSFGDLEYWCKFVGVVLERNGMKKMPLW